MDSRGKARDFRQPLCRIAARPGIPGPEIRPGQFQKSHRVFGSLDRGRLETTQGRLVLLVRQIQASEIQISGLVCWIAFKSLAKFADCGRLVSRSEQTGGEIVVESRVPGIDRDCPAIGRLRFGGMAVKIVSQAERIEDLSHPGAHSGRADEQFFSLSELPLAEQVFPALERGGA